MTRPLFTAAAPVATAADADLADERRHSRAPSSMLCRMPADAFAPLVFPPPITDPALVGRDGDV